MILCRQVALYDSFMMLYSWQQNVNNIELIASSLLKFTVMDLNNFKPYCLKLLPFTLYTLKFDSTFGRLLVFSKLFDEP